MNQFLEASPQAAIIAPGKCYSSAAMGEKLLISPNTVDTHVQHICRELGIHKRSELISCLLRDS